MVPFIHSSKGVIKQERSDANLSVHIGGSPAREHADAPHPLGWLRPRRERPRHGRAAEKRDELSPLHSITVSARTSSSGGIVRPSALAVLRLMTNCTFVG